MSNIASKVSKAKHPNAEQLCTEVNWMAKRLVEARHTIGDEPLVVKYIDTNGNERTKTNPAYDAYNSLFSSYLKGAKALDEMLADAGGYEANPKLALDNVMVLVNKTKAV